MIRHVLYVDLPGIIYALDRRARTLGRPFATFISAPEYEETHSGLAAVLQNLLPVRAQTHTWICEERWRLLGVAQARERPRMGSWELLYLGSLVNQPEATFDILRDLIEFATNDAIRAGMLRVFARVEEVPEYLKIFQRVGYQRYARELLYVRPSPLVPAEEATSPLLAASDKAHQPRRWHKHDGWGVVRLHDVTTPRKVQVAENLSADELLLQLQPGNRTWHIPGIEPRDESYVIDLGSRLAAWVRIRQSWAGVPHQIWVKVHQEHADLGPEIIRFALRRLCQPDILPGNNAASMPVICHVRDYDGITIDALRHEGFEHQDSRAVLVRHLTLSAMHERFVPGFSEARISYGVKGLGTIQSVTLSATREEDTCSIPRSPMTSTSCSPRSRHASRRPSRPIRAEESLSKSSWISDVFPRPASPAKR